jgi:hypothetical protein
MKRGDAKAVITEQQKKGAARVIGEGGDHP